MPVFLKHVFFHIVELTLHEISIYPLRTMMEIVAIKMVDDEYFSSQSSELMAELPPPAIELVKKYKGKADFQRSLLGEVLARTMLSETCGIPPNKLIFLRSEKGKPKLRDIPSLYFNISHSGKWIIVVVADVEVGIDIEKIRPPQYRIAERYFSSHEVETLNSLSENKKVEYFFDLWTLKESYLKLIGKGLTKSLGSFTMAKIGQRFRLVIEDEIDEFLHFYQLSIDSEYKCALCTTSADIPEQVNTITLDDLKKRLAHGK